MSERSAAASEAASAAADERRPPRWLALAPIAFLLLWSGGYTGVKAALPFIAPINMLVVRYALVVALLGLAFLIVRPPLPRTAAEWRHLAMTGLLIQGLYFLCMNLAMWLGVPAGVLAILLSPQPILVALVVPRLAGEGVPGRVWLGLLLGLAGALIVVAARTEISATSVAGIMTGVAGLIAITSGTLYEKRFGSGQHPVTANLVQGGVGLLLALPLALALEDMSIRWTGQFVLAMGYLVIANSIIAMTLLLAMIRHGAAARVSALFFLMPPSASLIAWGLLGEAMPPLAFAGMGVAALGVLLVGSPLGRAR